MESEKKFDAIILCVSHDEFGMIDIKSLLKNDKSVLYDVKGFYPKSIVDMRL